MPVGLEENLSSALLLRWPGREMEGHEHSLSKVPTTVGVTLAKKALVEIWQANRRSRAHMVA